ncbi:MAG: response regulator transcription factor [Sideroxydans sp.]|jgi:DNA-binding response OmpR family regulator
MKSKLSVMLIEDNDKLRETTAMFLEQSGFHVFGVPCAEDVDDTVLPIPPDLYIVDLNLPGEDGISLAHRIRKAHPSAGIVITSARTRLDERVEGYESGADIYLPKPVDPLELVAALNSLGRRVRDKESQLPEWALDFDKFLLTGPAADVKLSQPEARLLAALATAPEYTLQYWQVSFHLVGTENELSANALQVRLSTLRKKLILCGAETESIRVIRGEGYQLCIPLSIS